MLTLQSILKLHSVKNGSAPYAKPVKVVVCGVSDAFHYKNERKPDNKMWIVGLADESMAIKGVLYHEEHLQKCVVGHCLLISNAIVKSDPESLVITRETVLRRSGGLEVQEDLQRLAKLIACPMPAPEVPLVRVGTSPVKTMVTVVGRIVSEEVTRKVLVKGKEVNIKSVELEDNSGKCRLTLWRDHADSNVAVGSYVRATELVVQTYKDEKSLSTTYKTKLATIECPEETRDSILIAFEKGDVVCSLTFEEGENYPTYTVDLAVVETALDCGEEAVEEALASMVPINTRVTVLNGHITNLSLL